MVNFVMFLSKGVVVKDELDRPVTLHGSFNDVTDIFLAENAMREAEDQFSVFFKNSPIGLSITAPDGTLVAGQPGICRYAWLFHS